MNFPSSPTVGQVYTDPTGNVSYQWNGVQWMSTKALPVASDADMNAGVADFVFATPKKLKFGFAALLAENGFFKFPNWLGGLHLKWGKIDGGSVSSYVFLFPTGGSHIPFTQIYNVQVTGITAGTPGQDKISVKNVTINGFTSITYGSVDAADIYWFAIGK